MGIRILVADDEPDIVLGLSDRLKWLGHEVTSACDGQAALTVLESQPVDLVFLDLEMPRLSGIEALRRTRQRWPDLPVIILTAHGTIPLAVEAMKDGAVDFLTKPFREADLMRAINAALAQNRDARRKSAELADLSQRLSTLTPREREVLPLVVSGLLNKQAAAELGISEVTLQIHRGSIMKKMEAGSLAELVRMAGTLEIPMTHSRHAQR